MKQTVLSLMAVLFSAAAFSQTRPAADSMAVDATTAQVSARESLAIHPNNTCETAPLLSCGQSTSSSPGCLTSMFYVDLWTFSATAGQMATIRTTSSNPNQMLITVQDDSGVLASTHTSGVAQLPFTFPYTGTFFIGFGYVANFVSAPYTIGVTCGSGGALCTPSATTLCLLNSRFQVTLSVNDPRVSGTGSANSTVQGDWGYFDVPAATGTSDKPVIFVKLIDGRNVNSKYWVFYGGLTDIQYTFIVTDKQTGATRTYSKATGTYDGRADTSAFSGP